MLLCRKLRNDKHKPQDVEPMVEESLKKLQLKYLDLVLIHWPFDPEIEPVCMSAA